uniref:Uncharacterized protein n=1 Tax=Plectus sambesii TaxID=2011161 RepID=A0A914UX88_9BILA
PGVFGGLPTSGSFGASSASGLFGAPSASVSFGASSAPGVFGAPSASVSFGASSAPGLFGASSTSGVFGAPSASVSFGASSAPGLFGASHGRGNGTAIKEKCFVPLSCKSGGSADKVLKEVTVSEKKRSWNEEGDMLGWSTVCNNVNEGGSIAETDNDGCTVEIDKVLAELPKRQRDKKAKAHVQLNALVGRGEEQLHEMCDDQPPTVIEKLINPPINSAIAVFIKLSDIQQKISTDNNAKESRLLSFIAAMVASTLPNSPSEKDLLKSLLEKSSEEIRIREVNESQYVVECDAGQLVTVPSILLAIHWKIRLNKLCGIETQNLLIQFLSVVVGTTRNGAMESLAKQVIAALDA